MADKITNLYNALVKSGYNMASEEVFRERMNDPSKRKAAYDAMVKSGYNMRPYEEFEANIGYAPKPQAAPEQDRPQAAVQGTNPQETSEPIPRQGFLGTVFTEAEKKLGEMNPGNMFAKGVLDESGRKMEEFLRKDAGGNSSADASAQGSVKNVSPVQESSEDDAVNGTEPDQQGWKPTEMERIRLAHDRKAILDRFNSRSKERLEQTARLMEPLSDEGRRKLKAMKFQAQAAGAPARVLGITPSASKPEGEQNQAQAGEGVAPAGLSPVHYGVRYEDGKPVTEWLLPDGTLTTNYIEADVAEFSARNVRLRNEFVGRMRENGLDPAKQEDVERQAHLDAEASMRRKRTDLEQRRMKVEERLKELYAQKEKELNEHPRQDFPLPAGAVRTPSYVSGASRSKLDEEIEDAMLEWETLGKSIEEYDRNKRASELGIPGSIFGGLKDALTDMDTYTGIAGAVARNRGIERAVRNIGGSDMANELIKSYVESRQLLDEQSAMGETPSAWYSGGHFVGEIVADPFTYISLGLGSSVEKMTGKALVEAGKRNIEKNIAQRLLLSNAGKMAVSKSAGGAANFFAFEGLGDIKQQLSDGGWYDEGYKDEDGNWHEPEFHKGFSWGHALKRGGHGFMLGSVMGAFGAGIGNAGTYLTRSIKNTAGKVAVRGTEQAVGVLGEGTIFAMPEIIEFHTMDDDRFDALYAGKFGYADESDPERRRKARSEARDSMGWDTWTQSQANIFGMKLAGKAMHPVKAVKDVGSRINELMGSDKAHGLSFSERVDRMMDRSPFDLGLTEDERRELRDAGYGGLEDLFSRTKGKKGNSSADRPAGADYRATPGLRINPDSRRGLSDGKDADGYGLVRKLMEDKGISQSARAKVYFILTGNMLPQGTVVGYDKKKLEDGRIQVRSVTADEETVTSRIFKDEKSAEAEIDNICRQAELNAVEAGEYVAENYKSGLSEEIRSEIKKETGVDVDKVLSRRRSDRSADDRNALSVYLQELYSRAKTQEEKFEEDSRQWRMQRDGRLLDFVPEREEAEKIYDEGRGIYERFEAGDETAGAEADALSFRMQEAYQGVEEAFGSESEYYMSLLVEDPWGVMKDPGLTPDQRDAVLYFINSMAAIDGVMDASNESAEHKRDEIRRSVEVRTHKDKGIIQPAVLKVDDRRVYIVSGDVVMFPDGSDVDKENSSSVLYYVDESGEYKPISPDQIKEVGEAMDPQEELRAANEVIEQEQMSIFGDNVKREQEDGDEGLDIAGNDVTSHHGNGSEQDNDEREIARQDDGSGVAADPTGSVEGDRYRSDIRVYEEGLGSSRDEHSEYSERNRREAESERLVGIARQNEDPVEIIGKGKFGNIFSAFRNKAKAAYEFLSKLKSGQARGVFYRPEIGEIDLVWGEAPTPYSGKGLAHIDRKHVQTLGDFASMEEAIEVISDVIKGGDFFEQNSRTAIIDKDKYRVVIARDDAGNWVLTAFDNKTAANKKKKRKDAATLGTAGQPLAEARAVATDLSEGKDNTSFSDRQGFEQGIDESALSRIPTNEQGEPMFEEAEADHTWDALVESGAEGFADTRLRAAEKALKSADKLRNDETEFFRYQARQREIDKTREDAQRSVDYWNRVKGVGLARAEEAKRAEEERIARDRAAAAAAAEEERQAEEAWNAQKARIDKKLRKTADAVKECEEAVAVLEDLDPHDIWEAASVVLSSNKLIPRNDGTKKGFREMTGYKSGEQRKLVGLFAKAENGGKTLERLAEDAMEEECSIHGIPYENGEALNALLDVLQGCGTVGDIRNYIRNNRINQALSIHDRWLRDQEWSEEDEQEYLDYLVYQEYGVSAKEYSQTLSEYDAYMEDNLEKIDQDFDNNEFYGIIADELAARGLEKIEDGNRQGEIIQGVLGGEEDGSGDGSSGTGKVSGSVGEFLPDASAVHSEGVDTHAGGSGVHEEDGLGVAVSPAAVPSESSGRPVLGGYPPQAALRETESQGNGILPHEAVVEPTEAQKAVGNYKMGHRLIDGYKISIENPKGSVRRGKDADGTEWETKMQNDYGYIRGTEDADGEPIDVFLSDTPEEGDVFVIDQRKADGSFDEHKVMYGFPSEEAAREAYLSNYEAGWTGLGAITGVSRDEFKKWVESSKHKTKAFAEYKAIKDQAPVPTLMNVVSDLYNKGKEYASQQYQMKYFDVAETPAFMKSLGLTGDKFTIRYGVIARHLGKDGSHDIGEKEWEKLPEALQHPFAITRLGDKDKGYRLYTTLKNGKGEYIVVGVDVKNSGRDIEVNAISTVFGRRENGGKTQREEVIYTDKEITPEQKSLLNEPNLRQYPTAQESNLSEGKDSTLSSDKQEVGKESFESVHGEALSNAFEKYVGFKDNRDFNIQADKMSECAGILKDLSRGVPQMGREELDAVEKDLDSLVDSVLETDEGKGWLALNFTDWVKDIYGVNSRRAEIEREEAYRSAVDNAEELSATTPRRRKVSIGKFVDPREGSVLGGVYHHPEMRGAVASDGRVLVISNKDFDERLSGKTVVRPGEVDSRRYPNVGKVIPSDDILSWRSPADFGMLEALAEDALIKDGGGRKHDPGTQIVIKANDGDSIVVDAGSLRNFAAGARNAGATEFGVYRSDVGGNFWLMAKGDNGLSLLLGSAYDPAKRLYGITLDRTAFTGSPEVTNSEESSARLTQRHDDDSARGRYPEEETGSADLQDIAREVAEGYAAAREDAASWMRSGSVPRQPSLFDFDFSDEGDSASQGKDVTRQAAMQGTNPHGDSQMGNGSRIPRKVKTNLFDFDFSDEENPVSGGNVKGSDKIKRQPGPEGSSKHSGNSGRTEIIEDFGEKIAGARKDLLKDLSRNLGNVNVESLVKLPLGKVMKRPEFGRMVEQGAMTPAEATVAEAMWQTVYSRRKPTATPRNKRAILDWAEETASKIKDLEEFINADGSRRREIMEGLDKPSFPNREAEALKFQKVQSYNPDRRFDTPLFTPSSVWVNREVMKLVGSVPGDGTKIECSVHPNLTYQYYEISDASGLRIRGVGGKRDLREALEAMALVVRSRRGDRDIVFPADFFRVAGVDPIKEETGEFEVVWLKSGYQVESKVYADRESAEKKLASLLASKKTARIHPKVELKGYRNYEIRFRNPITDEEVRLEDKYPDAATASQSISDGVEELSGHVNSLLSERDAQKGKSPKKDHYNVVSVYDRTGRYYAVCRNNVGGKLTPRGGEEIKRFDSLTEARSWFDENRARLEREYAEMIKKKREFVFFRQTSNPRKGTDYRAGRDVTPEEFSDTFGFRGVQFGNWTKGTDRQAALNEAYDALRDLAGIIGVAPRMLSLNGELGLAFGSRGSGNANAHYEPKEVVINLTKTRGAGSLAHEWWHALDNYLMRRNGVAYGFATEHMLADSAMRNGVAQAISKLVSAIRESNYDVRSSSQGEYWGRVIEETARLFGEWVVMRQEKRGERNYFLSRGIDPAVMDMYRDMTYDNYKSQCSYSGEQPMSLEEWSGTKESLGSFPYPTMEELHEFDPLVSNVFKALRETEFGGLPVEESAMEPTGGYAPGLFKEKSRMNARQLSLFDDDLVESIDPEAEVKRIDDAVDSFCERFAEIFGYEEDSVPEEVLDKIWDSKESLRTTLQDYFLNQGNSEKDAEDRAKEMIVTLQAQVSVAELKKRGRVYGDNEAEISAGSPQAAMRGTDTRETSDSEKGRSPQAALQQTETGENGNEGGLSAYASTQDAGAERGENAEREIRGTGEVVSRETAGGGILHYRHDGWLPELGEGHFSLMERVFSETGEFRFSGDSKIESADDVAYMFRNLESKSIENSFAVLTKDGVPVVVHLGMGTAVATIANIQAIKAADNTIGGADRIWFVHNHPSGNLNHSPQDMQLHNNLAAMLGDKIEPSIIMDTLRGEYSEFGDLGDGIHNRVHRRPESARGSEGGVRVYRFDGMVYSDDFDFSKLSRVASANDVASLLSGYRLGSGAKAGVIVLSNSGNVVANLPCPHLLDSPEGIDSIVNYAIHGGGSRVIVYGNEGMSRDRMRRLGNEIKQRSGQSIQLLDVITIEGHDYRSGVDSGLMEPDEMRYGREVPEIENRLREEESIERANRQFNTELEQQIEGKLPEGHIYQLGKPGEILRAAGFPDMPIELSARHLSKKAAQRNHEFSIDDVRDLPKEIQKPIAVFHYGDRSKAENVVIGLNKEGKQFVVGVHFNQTRGGIVVSSIRGLFPKDNAEWLNWISQGKAEWLDKEKIQTLIDQQRTNLADVEYLDLESVTNIVKSFENPKYDEEGGVRFRDGGVDSGEFFKRASAEAKKLDMQERVEALSKELNTPVRVIKDSKELGELNEDGQPRYSRRERRAKGWWSSEDNGVVVVLPNNVNVADVDNTVVHEVVGHKGLRALIGEERFDEFLDEIYDHASDSIRERIMRETDRMVSEEADRLRLRKSIAHESAGEDVNSHFFTDMAEARVEAEKKRKQYRREATEEYMADLSGRIGSEGFEKMSRDELTLWGKIKAKVQQFLDRFLQGLKIAKSIQLNDKHLSYILYKSWKNLREARIGHKDVFMEAEDAVMRHRTGWDAGQLREMTSSERMEARREVVADRIEELFEEAVAGNLKGKPVEVGRLTEAGRKYLEKLSDIEMKENVSFVLNPSDMMHMYRNHFGGNEKDKGNNIPLTKEDIRAIAEVISHPERIVYGKEPDGLKRNLFYFLSSAEGGAYNLLEIYGDRKGNLTAKTFYKTKKAVSQRVLSLMKSEHLTSVTDGASLLDGTKLPILFEYPKSEDENTLRFRDPGLGLEETITKMKADALQANADNLQAKRETMRAIGGNLNYLRQAMARQREYDITTVKSVTDLARVLMDSDLLDGSSKVVTKRILSLVNKVVGRQDVSWHVQKLLDIMVDNQLRKAADVFKDLLSIKGSRVDARGIEVQGKLDPDGQRIAQVVRKSTLLPKDDIENRISEAINRMSSTDNTIADEATIEYAGLQIARQYVEDITESSAEEKALRDSLKQAKEDKDAGQMTEVAYKQYVEATNDAIRQNKIDRAEAYGSLIEQVGGVMAESVSRAKAWREEQKGRIQEIHHNANSDMEGRPTDEHHKDTRIQKFVNNSAVRFLLAPLATFDQMLRMFGKKNIRGEGYLWNRYMRGWVDASEKEYTGYQKALKVLDEKVAEVFAKAHTGNKNLIGTGIKSWGDLFAIDRKLPKGSVSFWDGGEMKDHELTQGNLLYIYMADKMSDGRMKLRRMGITEDDIENIKNFLDSRFIQLADWMQEEFLVDKRNEYNEVHKRMFGASMAAIENYFPLKILANARMENVDVADDTTDTALPATSTGSIIKRRRNNLALDVTGANAFSVILDHLQQMERWAAFAEFNRDLNTLLSYKRFRNQVMNMSSAYGAGKTLWNNFRNVCSMAAGSYRPPIAALDKSAVNIAKGVTAAKVSFRLFTALKQFLSMPAYISDSNPKYLVANIANPIGAWNWTMQNLPLFEKRWKSRMAGDPRLLKTDMDWKMWRSRVVELASRMGMSPNAFVDAMTVAIGAHSMYQTKLAKYKRQGYDTDVAEKRAKQDATILFNQTQQSSEGAFLSTMQVDRSWLSVLFTVFRNSSMSYSRQLYDAIRNISHRFTPGYKGLTEEFMAKQMRRDGIDPDKADSNAKREYRRGIIRDLVRVGVFGYILQFAWNLGAYLPYLILGDNDDEKDKMMDDVFNHSMFGSIEGLTGGDVMSAAGNMLVSGEGNPAYLTKDMPLASDVLSILKNMDKDQVAAMNDVINLCVQSGLGVNPQSLTDAVTAVMDFCGDDAETSRECALLIARVLNCPQSQIDKMYFDELDASAREASKMTPSEIAERYARYKIRRGTQLTGWAYGNEQREELMEKYRKRSNTVAKERLANETTKVAGPKMSVILDEYKQTKDRVSEINKVKSRDEERYYELLDELEATPEFERYLIVREYKRDVDDLTKRWLRATTPAESDSCVKAIFARNREMMDEVRQAQ